MASDPRLVSKPLHLQVKEVIVARYIPNEAPIGAKIPSDKALSRELGVNPATVSKALNELAYEGMVTRRIGAGTFVAGRPARAGCVGIYFGGSILYLGQPIYAAHARIDEALQRGIVAAGKRAIHYFDSRIPELWSQPLENLVEDARSGRLERLIVVRANPCEYAWLQKLETDVIGFGGDYATGSVRVDVYSFSRQAVRHLLGQGCREIGFVTKVPCETDPRFGKYFSIHEGFHDGLADAGLRARPEWVISDDQEPGDPDYPEEFGREAFRRLWAQPHRPEALVIHSDIVALGMARAARERGIDLAKEMRIVIWANAENRWPELDSFPQLRFSMRQVAQALLDHPGRSRPEPILIPPVLVEEPSAAS